MVRAEERGRENRLNRWDNGRAGKLFAGMSEVILMARLHVEIL